MYKGHIFLLQKGGCLCQENIIYKIALALLRLQVHQIFVEAKVQTA